MFKLPEDGQQVPHIIDMPSLESLLDEIGSEVASAENKYPRWPEDLNYGDQVINEEKGEATKALLDIPQGRATVADARSELVQTAAMCVRQIAAIDKRYS